MRLLEGGTANYYAIPLMIIDNLAPNFCIPFTIGDGPSLSGPRIGGGPPLGVFSTRSTESHYLLTLALEEDGAIELSLFLHPDWWEVVFNKARTLHSQDDPWVEFVVHGTSVRRLQDNSEAFLLPHPILYGSIELDRQGDTSEDEPGAPLWEHKLGGMPYFVRYKPQLVDAIRDAEANGYRQLFQLAFPGPKDANFVGDWPFADGMFYLFFKSDEGRYHWYYGWLY